MLPKKYRLVRKGDFDKVYKRGNKFRITCLLVAYSRSKYEASRLGFVVSKKVSKQATRRNYLKRVMRDVFKDLPLKLKMSYDVIITLSTDPANLSPKLPVVSAISDTKSAILQRINR